MNTRRRTTWEEVKVAISHKARFILGISSPDGKHLYVWVPSLYIFDLVESHTKQVLVNLQNCRNDHRYREVLFYERIIEGKGFLDIQPVVITIIPYIEFAVERLPFGLEVISFEFKESFALQSAQRAQSLLEVSQKL